MSLSTSLQEILYHTHSQVDRAVATEFKKAYGKQKYYVAASTGDFGSDFTVFLDGKRQNGSVWYRLDGFNYKPYYQVTLDTKKGQEDVGTMDIEFRLKALVKTIMEALHKMMEVLLGGGRTASNVPSKYLL